jgi:hypothetical protein
MGKISLIDERGKLKCDEDIARVNRIATLSFLSLALCAIM